MKYNDLIQDTDNYYRQIFSTGWLDEWCEEDVEILKEALDKISKENKNYMVYALSEYSLDAEDISTPGDYENIIYRLLTAFDIEIKRNDIIISQDGNNINIDINTPEGIVSWDFEQDGDWLHEEIFDFLNEDVLPAMGEEKELYPLPPSSTVLEIVYHYPEIIDKALEAHIIPDDDYFINL